MKYAVFGRSGLRVSRLTLGAMTFGAGTGVWTSIAKLGREQAARLVGSALDCGVNMIDTADAYSQGQSETIVGQVLHDLGADETRMLVATKVRLRTGHGVNQVGLGRSHIIKTVETSLKRLGRDHIDLLQIHDRDAVTPLDETLRALDDLIRQGKIRHLGVCNFTASELELAHAIASHAHWNKITSAQVHYSLASRDVEYEIMPVARKNNVALMVWSPLSGGYLSGKYTLQSKHADKGRRANLNFPPIRTELVDPIVEELRLIGLQLNRTPAQIALAWLLNRQEIATVIIGATSNEQLTENLTAEDLELKSEYIERLDRISLTPLPYPYWMQQLHDRDRM